MWLNILIKPLIGRFMCIFHYFNNSKELSCACLWVDQRVCPKSRSLPVNHKPLFTDPDTDNGEGRATFNQRLSEREGTDSCTLRRKNFKNNQPQMYAISNVVDIWGSKRSINSQLIMVDLTWLEGSRSSTTLTGSGWNHPGFNVSEGLTPLQEFNFSFLFLYSTCFCTVWVC